MGVDALQLAPPGKAFMQMVHKIQAGDITFPLSIEYGGSISASMPWYRWRVAARAT